MSELIHCAFPFCLDFTTDEREPWYCVKHTDAGPLLVALNARIADLERQLAAVTKHLERRRSAHYAHAEKLVQQLAEAKSAEAACAAGPWVFKEGMPFSPRDMVGPTRMLLLVRVDSLSARLVLGAPSTDGWIGPDGNYVTYPVIAHAELCTPKEAP